jgi:hypothetical protein
MTNKRGNGNSNCRSLRFALRAPVEMTVVEGVLIVIQLP